MNTEEFWQGPFGTDYLARNRVDWKERVPFWQHIVELTGATSFLDIGTNAGWNLHALRSISPEFTMSGVDINIEALREAQAAGFDVAEVPAHAVVETFGPGAAELVVTSGVLIHIAPDDLPKTLAAIHDASSRYVLAIEYAGDVETEVEYRGNAGKLWRRPFGELYMQRGLSLVETGVAQGFRDCTYWLMEKS
jgi:pseudaminic acid biosynthesis-associated methylase